MRLKLISLAICCLLTGMLRAQPPDSLRYRINLPSYWKPGNKVWKILTDKLPFVCNELQDKMLCGDNCHPLYHIEMMMTRPEIFDFVPVHMNSNSTTEDWQIQTKYGFECSLLLMNNQDQILTRFILVDTDEVWQVNHTVQLPNYVSAQPVRYMTRGRNPQFVAVQNPTPATMPESPLSWIDKHENELVPELKDLFAVVDNKIRSWK